MIYCHIFFNKSFATYTIKFTTYCFINRGGAYSNLTIKINIIYIILLIILKKKIFVFFALLFFLFKTKTLINNLKHETLTKYQ
jgi:hypothetical protein